MERKLSSEQMICNVCAGSLRELTKEEKKKVRVRFNLPRGIFVCEECGELATVGLTPVDLGKGEWREIIEVLDRDELSTEREAIDNILEIVSLLPEGHTRIVSIGKLFRCEGKGVKCSIYKTASCGLGPKEFCPGGWCNYDPYPTEYKKIFWYKTESSWSKNNIILDYWFNIILSKENDSVIVDAINRVSTIATRKVSSNLCNLFFRFRKRNLTIAKAVISGLIKQQDSFPKIKKIFLLGLSHNSPADIQLFILDLLRRYYMFDIVELSRKISHLAMITKNKIVRESARKTLIVFKMRASKEKPDLKISAMSEKN